MVGRADNDSCENFVVSCWQDMFRNLGKIKRLKAIVSEVIGFLILKMYGATVQHSITDWTFNAETFAVSCNVPASDQTINFCYSESAVDVKEAK